MSLSLNFLNVVLDKFSPKTILTNTTPTLSRQTTDSSTFEPNYNIFAITNKNEIRLMTNNSIKSITINNSNPNIILSELCNYHNKTQNTNIALNEFIDFVFFGHFNDLILKNNLFKSMFKQNNNYVLQYKYIIMKNDIIDYDNTSHNNYQ